MRVSATIIALDEEAKIARAIRSVAFCDEVLLIDSGSTDRTVEIAEELGARVIRRAWPGYAAQKNFAASAAANDWILSIDGDEEVGADLAASIQRLGDGESACAGYSFPRMAHYCGRWIRHSGWYPDRKVRLYRRDRAKWMGDYVHESVTTSGPVEELDGDLLHHTCDTLIEHRERVDRYTDLAAEEIRALGRSAPLWRVLLTPPFTFFKAYALQLGFLDGAQGLAIAWMASRYGYLKYSKARKLAKA